MHMTTQPRIAYDDLGEKEPAVVFLPGWCSGRGVFRDLLPLMAKTRRSLALDWRGHGESERSTGVDLPDLDRQIAEMREYGFDTWARAGREISAQFSRRGVPLMR